ncbi:MAG: DNA polymerase I [Planctomycetales bacterium]|nr:DNA polymerase I [Planctomycetales bacterium]
MPDTLYIIDVFSLLFQVFHAIPEMSSPSGQPTNAVFGMTRDILNILKQKQPSHLICAMDSKGPGVRDEIYDQYKAHRAPAPPDLLPQIPLTVDVIRAFGIPAIEQAGWEADDVIATVVTQAVERGLDVAIVTGDKDARQLLGPRVRIYFVRKDQFFDEAALLVDWGVRPDQVIDFQSLVGDAVDNVPGVPLIGPKKASALLQQFGTLEEVLAHADEAPGAKMRENLKKFADQARLSRDLVTLRRDLPLTVDWDAARVGHHDRERLVRLFQQFGFRRFQDEVKALPSLSPPNEGGAGGGTPSTPTGSDLSSQNNSTSAKRTRTLFDDDQDTAPASDPVVSEASEKGSGVFFRSQDSDQSPRESVDCDLKKIPAPVANNEIIDTPDKLADFVRELQPQRRFVFNLITSNPDPMRAEIVGWVFFSPPDGGRFIPVRSRRTEDLLSGLSNHVALDQTEVTDALRPVLERDDLELCGHDLKSDLVVLRRLGINVRGVGIDSYVGSYLLDAGAKSHSLEDLAIRQLDRELPSLADVVGAGTKGDALAEIEPAKLAMWAGGRARIARELATVIEQKLREDAAIWRLYWDLERPLIAILAEMQFHGIHARVAALREQSIELGGRLKQLEDEIYTEAKHPFNIASPIQLRQVLFEELGLPVLRKTKTGASTDQEVLEQLALVHPLPAKLIEHRQLAKLKGTYLDALPELVNPITGRIHTTFHQVAAATGRLSSSDPNLQNIPIRTAEGRRVRQAFVAGEPGWKLLCADYSQIELRILAHFCGDPALATAFADDIDIHAAVAAQVYGIDVATVDESQRRVAKAVNFGVIYGQSPFGLAANLGIKKDAAAQFIDEYFAKYAGVATFIERVLSETAAAGQATTILGRKRAIDGVRPNAGRNLNLPERTAVNTVIQGSAADLIKQAMLNIHRRLRREAHPARLLLQIHDELVFETPSHHVLDLAGMVRHEMEHAFELSVPLKVELSVGDDWLNLESIG